MAKKYIRVNWQDYPSTATPRNATNLNKMDKGIDDLDTAVGDLALLKTIAKSSIVAAVNEQNDNLASYIGNIASIANGDYDFFVDGYIYASAGNANKPLDHCLVTTRSTASGVRLQMATHINTPGTTYKRMKISSGWSGWYATIGAAL